MCATFIAVVMLLSFLFETTIQDPCRFFFSHFQLFFNVRHIYCNNRINHTATKIFRGNTIFFLAAASVFSCNITTSFATQHNGGNIIYQSQ